MVNAIPERVTLESYVRGKTFSAISGANKKVNRALVGAALSLGANIEIEDLPGYSPLENAEGMIEVASEAVAMALEGVSFINSGKYGTGSTDMGDLSAIMPVIHPSSAGAKGTSHGADYEIADPYAACVDTARWQLAMIKLLMSDGAARAKKIVAEYKAPFASKEEFLAYQNSLRDSGDRIVYTESGADVRL